MRTENPRDTSILKWAASALKRAKSSKATVVERPRYALAAGQRVYAIGDVHGRHDLLIGLLDKLEHDSASRSSAKTTIVMIGDLIDRGPESAAIVELVSSWTQSWADMISIQGNHEAMLKSLLDGQSVSLANWLKVGGDATLRSYGIGDELIQAAHTGALLEIMRTKIPKAHQRWLGSLASHWHCGDYLFAHAGIRPGVPIERQLERDLLGIRREFLESKLDHGHRVVHGHSVMPSVDQQANRIGIDTGAWQTGRLTAVGIEDSEVWFVDHTMLPPRVGDPQTR